MAPLIATVAWRYSRTDSGELFVTTRIDGITEKLQWLEDNLTSLELIKRYYRYPGSGLVYMKDVYCNGKEEKLWDCGYRWSSCCKLSLVLSIGYGDDNCIPKLPLFPLSYNESLVLIR